MEGMNMEMAASQIQFGIILASNNAERLQLFIDHIIALSSPQELAKIELLINLPDEEAGVETILSAYENKIKIKFIKNAYTYTNLNLGYDELYRHHAETSTKYFTILCDRFRFGTEHFVDKITDCLNDNPQTQIIRISNHRKWDGKSLSNAWHHCENWGFYSRSWLDNAGGWGLFWCPDATQEFIFYFCKKLLGLPLKQVPFVQILDLQIYRTSSTYFNHGEALTRYLLGEFFFQHYFLSANYLTTARNYAVNFLTTHQYVIKNKTEINKAFLFKERLYALTSLPSLSAYIVFTLYRLTHNKKITIFIAVFCLAPPLKLLSITFKISKKFLQFAAIAPSIAFGRIKAIFLKKISTAAHLSTSLDRLSKRFPDAL